MTDKDGQRESGALMFDCPPLRNGEVFELHGVVIYETDPGVARAAKEAVARMHTGEA